MAKAAQAVEVKVTYDLTNQLTLAKEAPSLERKLEGFVIKNQEDLDKAIELATAGDTWLDAVGTIMGPVRKATHEAWKAAIKASDDFIAPVEGPLQLLKQAIYRFRADQQRITEELQRKKDADQRKLNEAAAKKVEVQAKKSGADSETVTQLKEQILATPAPIVAPRATVSKGAGFALRTVYGANIINFRTFLKAILDDKTLFGIFEANDKVRAAFTSELSDLAKKQKDNFKMAGCELVKRTAGAGE